MRFAGNPFLPCSSDANLLWGGDIDDVGSHGDAIDDFREPFPYHAFEVDDFYCDTYKIRSISINPE